MMEKPVIGIVMGVSGSGKSTLGRALAQHWRQPFYEGDDYHTPENLALMRQGTPLADSDRLPWLHRIRSLVEKHLDQRNGAVISCSALKRVYRELIGRETNVWYLWMELPEDQLRHRLNQRTNHFMPPELLGSQLSSLEAPTPDEQFIRIDASNTTEASIEYIDARLRLRQGVV